MKAKWQISFFLVFSILVYFTFWNYNNRVYDWDMPGYIGTVYTWEFPNNPEKVHQLTFSSIKKEAFDLHYKDLVGTSPVIFRGRFLRKTHNLLQSNCLIIR